MPLGFRERAVRINSVDSGLALGDLTEVVSWLLVIPFFFFFPSKDIPSSVGIDTVYIIHMPYSMAIEIKKNQF